jgi:hypothetical protein
MPSLTARLTPTRTRASGPLLVQLSRQAHVIQTVMAFVRHLKEQAENGRAMYRGAGSIALRRLPRCLLIGSDPGDPDKRVLPATKTTSGPSRRRSATALSVRPARISMGEKSAPCGCMGAAAGALGSGTGASAPREEGDS